MLRYVCLLWLVMPSVVAAADRPISAEEFERIVSGETLSYRGAAGEYGAEEYFDNRRVLWSHLDGNCTEGTWYADGPQICFTYEDRTIDNPQCWTFFQRGDTLVAQFESGETSGPIVQTIPRSGPLYCLGPEVGA